MATDFDLNLFPLYRSQGQEMQPIPGLMATAPLKRTVHARKDESLFVHLTLSGNSRPSSAEYSQIVSRITGQFYQTSGSLTSAMRTAAGDLNQSLLKRNLQATGNGEFVTGRLILGALRGNQFFFAQCGPTHVFHLTALETRHIHDEQISGRGLGTSQAMPLYFAQIDLHAGDLLVFCPDLPAGWEAALLGEKNPSVEMLRRKLVSLASEDLNAVLVQVQVGKGNINILKGRGPAPEKTAPASLPAESEGWKGPGPVIPAGTARQTPVDSPQSAPPATPGTSPASPAIPTSRVESGRPASRFARILSGENKTAPAPVQAPRRPVTTPPGSVVHPLRQTGRFVSPRTAGDLPEIKRPVSRRRQEVFSGLVKVIQGMRAGAQRMSAGIKKFVPILLPNSGDDSEGGGSSAALFAIVIPVIIVALAVTVYIRYGRNAQYQQYYDMALGQASQARGQANPIEVRRAWDSTLYYLDLAENSQKTQDSITLRQEAQTALDNLDGILRLDFRPAIIGGLSRSVRISHMAATSTDLYLLDASRGGVIRAFLTNTGYEVDPSFQCDPGQYDTIIVDALIDLEVIPVGNSYNARLLAMDGKGTLLYCGLTEAVAVSPIPPQLGWRSISAFSLDSDGKNLYVLDPAANAVWQYSGSLGEFPDSPSLFFGKQVPQNMNTTIDLAANNADLYLLFQDGHVSSCPLAHYVDVPVRCNDPVTFLDARPERKPGPKINDAIFVALSFASAPDPSLYLLEPLTRAIYRFNPRSDTLELRGQFRASMEQNNALFDGPATAITISPNRFLFFSVGSQVFFAMDVP